jgi:hypothetical protein
MAEKGIVEKSAHLAGFALIAYWLLCTNSGRFVLMLFAAFCIYTSVWDANTGVHEMKTYDNGATVETRYNTRYDQCAAHAGELSRVGIINNDVSDAINDCRRKFPEGWAKKKACYDNVDAHRGKTFGPSYSDCDR